MKYRTSRIPVLAFLLLIVILVSGCTQSPSTPAESTDVKPKTVDELKEAKVDASSEYDKCVSEVTERVNAEEEGLNKCIKAELSLLGYVDEVNCIEEGMDHPICKQGTVEDCRFEKLEELGYSDGIDCLLNYEDPICTTTRYNAQVNAHNDCIDIVDETPDRYTAQVRANNKCTPPYDPTALTLIDCATLLET